MDSRIIIASSLVLALVLAGAGCMQPEKPVATPVPATVVTVTTVPATAPTPVPTTPATTEPGPTRTLPPGWDISVTVEKGGMYSRTVIVRFDGGKGLTYVSRMDVRVTFPDGTVKTDGIAKPKMGDAVEILGSTGTDRAEVILTMANGEAYTVADQQMPYRNKE